MRAIRAHAYGDPSVLSLDDIDPPEPGPRDLLVGVRAAAINPVDYKIRRGWQRAVIRLDLPAILGMDVCGVVEAVGEEVTRFSVGDIIVASPSHKRMGCYAEKVLVDEREAARKSDALTDVEAASIPLAGLTAWDCLVRHGKLAAGERVLIQAGAGGVGSLAIQIAKHLGAEVLTTASESSAEFVRSLGADTVIDYKRESFEQIAAGVDLVLDSLSGDALRAASRTVRRGGRIVTISPGMPEAVARWGAYLGVAAVGLSLAGFWLRCRLLRGVRFRPVTRKADGEALAELMDMCTAGALRPVVERTLPLAETARAHELLEAGGRRGKIVLAVG